MTARPTSPWNFWKAISPPSPHAAGCASKPKGKGNEQAGSVRSAVEPFVLVARVALDLRGLYTREPEKSFRVTIESCNIRCIRLAPRPVTGPFSACFGV
jgi:hypothetical protein